MCEFQGREVDLNVSADDLAISRRTPMRGTLVLVLLTLSTWAIAAYMLWAGLADWFEAVGFVSGAVCVWLVVRENVWNFPIGLLNVMTFSVVFFRVGLYADAGLQVVYFVLGCIGWYLWLFGGENRTRLHVGRASAIELLLCLTFVVISTLSLWSLLSHVGGSASFWDALTTSISLAAQWLINRKKLESWCFWIVVDVIYVPLYIYKELYLTAALYAVFLAMATMGLFQWLATWRAQRINAGRTS